MSESAVASSTRVLTHIGSPIAHAKAPAMFNAEMERRGLDAVLVPLKVPPEGLVAAFATLRAAENVGGLLVTMPHKRTIVGLCENAGREASFVGAANAVRFDAGRAASCEMFDGLGLVGALDVARIDLQEADVLLVGCGGAGSAIAAALVRRPIRSLTLHNRTPQAAELLARRLTARHHDVRVTHDRPATPDFQLVINATRLGMGPNDAMPVDLTGADCAVADIVTGHQRSALLRHADMLGLPTVDGEAMLRSQMSSIIDYWSDGSG